MLSLLLLCLLLAPPPLAPRTTIRRQTVNQRNRPANPLQCLCEGHMSPRFGHRQALGNRQASGKNTTVDAGSPLAGGTENP